MAIAELKKAPNVNEIIKRVLMVLLVLFVFLVSLSLMSGGFKLLGKGVAEEIMLATSNPFIGLFVGLLATALVQSSSTTTSMIVAIVASGAITLENAVPMIMGANIGTSVTSTIVALGHLTRKAEIGKAISAATVHDFFNLIVVLVLFPLEYFFGFLSTIGGTIGSFLYSGSADEGVKMFSIMGVTVKPTAKAIISLLGSNGWLVIGVSIVILFFSLRSFTVLLKKLLIGDSQKKMEQYVFSKPLQSLLWGAGLTAAVQSSSVTTSVTVPLVATNKLSLEKAFPFLMGANIGTTVTALIAAASQTEAALSIALCHLLFNLIGVVILFPIPILRKIPIFLAESLGKATVKHRITGFAYVLVTFFLVPFVLIYITANNGSGDIPAPKVEQVEQVPVNQTSN
ncbi:Na/Pi symporter [Flammeovirgaceae bacterium SG7u.111]|nr:Na/Pi symporter [Flammeovirgaceae bacterium SG7u.132]WPO34784.1 Na/Pi symporter [Flammeovirgaceae bacterium SG7u.111]